MYDSITEINLSFRCFIELSKNNLTGQRAAGPLVENVDRFMRFLTAIIMKRVMTVNLIHEQMFRKKKKIER